MLAHESTTTMFNEEAKYAKRRRIRNKNHLERLALTKMIFAVLAFLFAICSTISATNAIPPAGFDSVFIVVGVYCLLESLLGFYGTLKEKRCPMVANFTLSIISCIVLTTVFLNGAQLVGIVIYTGGQIFRPTVLSFVLIFDLCYLILTYISLGLLCYHWNCRCCDQGCCCCTREPDIFEPMILHNIEA